MHTTIKAALTACQRDLRQASAQIVWPRPENLHLTLNFLGEVEAARLPALQQICGEAARQSTALTLTTAGLGFFPNAKRPRVVWVGLRDETQQLQPLQQRLTGALAALDFAPDDKPFRPHLTLGRIKTPLHLGALVERANAYRFPIISFTVTELVLMQSQLHPAGSIYTPLWRVPLG